MTYSRCSGSMANYDKEGNALMEQKDNGNHGSIRNRGEI